MGDECTCEKCKGAAADYRGVAVVWFVGEIDAGADGRGGQAPGPYLITSEHGISLRRQSPEL